MGPVLYLVLVGGGLVAAAAISFVLRDADVVQAMNLLHDQFFSTRVGA